MITAPLEKLMKKDDVFVWMYMSMLGGKICRWILLFQDFDFEIIVNLGCLNVGLYHLSRIEIGKEPTNIEYGLVDAQLFKFDKENDHYAPII